MNFLAAQLSLVTGDAVQTAAEGLTLLFLKRHLADKQWGSARQCPTAATVSDGYKLEAISL